MFAKSSSGNMAGSIDGVDDRRLAFPSAGATVKRARLSKLGSKEENTIIAIIKREKYKKNSQAYPTSMTLRTATRADFKEK